MNSVKQWSPTTRIGGRLVSIVCVLGLTAIPTLAVTFTQDTLIASDDTTYDNDDIVVDGCTVTVNGAHPFNSIQIINGGLVTHSPNADTQEHVLDLTIMGDVDITLGSSLDVTGRGYASAQGPGAGGGGSAYGGGGAYGGNGGSSTEAAGGTAYGSVLAPMDIGSGGGRGEPYDIGGGGGGAIRLVVGGTLTIDGALRADGGNGTVHASNYGGGGSGGSICLTVGTFSGTGNISADGGDGYLANCGSGAGGRIAVVHDASAFTGSMTAYAGGPVRFGGAGTIYERQSAEATGALLIDNGGNAFVGTPLTSPEAFDVTIRNGAIVFPQEPVTFGNLEVGAQGRLAHPSGGPSLNLTIEGDALIAVDGSVDVTGRGYGSAQGPGAGGGGVTYGAGGAYGGAGAASTEASGGSIYGSVTEPSEFGSGGGRGEPHDIGGSGGGIIRITVAGLLQIDGTLLANGMDGGVASGNAGGGGAGGSIFVSADTLSGSGVISANGGNGYYESSGGGGGGRIALHYDTAYSFAGTVTAYGGGPSRWGGAGTVYMAQTDGPPGDLTIRNNGNSGAFTELPDEFPPFGAVDVADGGILAVPPTMTATMTDLDVLDGGVIAHRTTSDGGIHIQVANHATIAAGASIQLTGRGYPPRTGPGAGGSTISTGAGGGYGGPGGNGQDTFGGGTYGSVTAPTDLGSGGGEETDRANGGHGGGAVHLSVGGPLVLDGSVVANGSDGGGATSDDNGAGAGGSVWIEASSLAGAGSIVANGGNGGGGSLGGGGGGGRIAVHLSTNTFTGTMSSCAGTGYRNGGAGTIYVESADGVGSGFILDNCGVYGAETDLPLVTAVANDLFVQNAAILTHAGSLTIDGNVTVSDTGLITHPRAAEGGLSLHATGDVSIGAGGRISVGGRGYPARTGPGAGGSSVNNGAGGGYGGPGGNGQHTAGGSTYGSFTAPTDLGSGGGEETDGANGGPGGGAVHLIVDGTLTVQGDMLANGGNGGGSTSQDNGGGSGGSLWIEANSLAGAGSIVANGGNAGGGSLGGGGGGGRIAVYLSTNAFAGTTTACAGTGYRNGGAGTIYVESADGVGSGFILDNCGVSGAETDLPQVTAVDNDLFVRNAAILTHAGNLTIEGNVTVGDGGTITQPATIEDGLNLHATGDVMVAGGGRISVNSRGYPVRTGPGAGGSSTASGAGGGYGGRGGNGSNTIGGGTYGSFTEPADLGSGGGEETDGAYGGPGGGAVHLIVDGALVIHGDLLANGGNGGGSTSQDNGGGSGGSLWIEADTLSGAGTIAANGGNGGTGSLGGGGGGGRIAIYTCGLAIDPAQVTVDGGTGYQNGDPGTILMGSPNIVITQQPEAQIIAFEGDPVSMSVVAYTTTGELEYQWRKDGEDLENDGHYVGVETDTLGIVAALPEDMGIYDVWLSDACGFYVSTPTHLIVPPTGDVDCDGDVDFDDINPFVLALSGEAAYLAQYPHCRWLQADCDSDGDVDFDDINPFVSLLGS